MAKKARKLVCSKEDINELKLLASSGDSRIAMRASLVLGCAGGDLIKDIASKYSERPNTVIKWRDRYMEDGIAGLLNAPRGSTKDVYGETFAQRLIQLLEGEPPPGKAYWTGPLLAEALGAPLDTVHRYLRKQKIRLLNYRKTVQGETPSFNASGDGDDSNEVCSTPGSGEVTDEAPPETAETALSVSVTACGRPGGSASHPVDIHVHVMVMDGDICVRECTLTAAAALPALGHYDVKINDTS